MKAIAILPIFVASAIMSCSPANDKAWTSPNGIRKVTYHKGPSGPTGSNEDSFSFYSLFDIESGKRLITVRSIINEETSNFIQTQKVHYSPSGRTVLIEEDISDASPNYVYTLIYQDEDLFYTRDLAFPVRHTSSPIEGYGLWPDIISITDDSIEYSYPWDDTKIRSKISDLRERGL